MPKQNITLSLDKDLLRQTRQLSAGRSTSISNLLSEELERLVRDHKQYEQAKRRALAAMKRGFHMGGRIRANRDDLHERESLR